MEAGDPRNFVPPGRARPFFGFVTGVLALAVLVSAGPLAGLPGRLDDLPAAFWTMAALAVACDARPFVPPGRRESSAVFPSTCFTFAILLGWGLGPAVAVQAVAVAVSGWRMRHAAWRTIFNGAQYAVALGAAYAVTRLGSGGLFDGGRLHWTDVAVVGGATLAWFAANYGLVSTAVRLRFGERWWPGVRQGLPYELLSTGSLLLLAPVLVTAARASAVLIPLVLVPLFAVYRMARLSAEQEELASLDPLTGLPNRKALLAEVAEQVHLHAEREARGDPDGHLALLLIDLDRFKHVNDALGHAVGDRLLVEVSARLAAVVGPGDLVARLGGDEFAIVGTRLSGADQARELAERAVRALVEPVELDGLPLDVGGSIGIAVFPEHGEDYATLMRHADVAMYDAKHRNDTVAVYAAESDHNSAERLALLADLRRVLEAGPLAGGSAHGDLTHPVAGAQPPAGVRGSDGAALPAGPAPLPAARRPVGRRWGRRRRDPAELAGSDELINRIVTGADPIRRRAQSPADPAEPGGPGRPADPPPAADGQPPHPGPAWTGEPERQPDPTGAGVITMYYQPQIAIATGEVVGVEALLRWRHPKRGMVDPGELIQVAEQSAVMRLLTRRVVDDVVEQLAKWQAAGTDLRAALNVSVRDLHTGEVAEQIADRLTRFGVRPDRLQVEITEGALMADPRRVLATISQLHRIGVGIALDDFGTGYSSLQHLRRLPLSEVKVDRSFVLGMTEDADDAAIVRSMIELAGALGLRVVAEGVEDERTWRLLHAAGCDVAQGWFYARPMPAQELTGWLARYRPVRPTVTADGDRQRRPAR
ncbi:putative bifunctional diguanylate cyclase/phosphodiesterase [Micromonospora mirobrigensis]|uniref:Diguanylate cyclase/phosphodiesterase n=1 Tax=Micromonospora mirobrigensis TaxID=262898 RepID=A0A1C4U505_9ACTN|nr:EAL domain-containing protein [Micromonospora mirobrigensis]SCE66798.1 diguanylate cyclase/phosphodiesterase [Micromonospora mirobrigensis]